MKKGRKYTFWAFSGAMCRYTLGSGHFGQCVPVHVRGVPVHPALVFLVSTIFRILAITCSFLIRFE